MFWFFPTDAATQAMLAAATAQAYGTTVSGTSGVDDSLYREWVEHMNEYNRVHHNHFEGSPKNNFWVVVALPKEDFSENLEWHETIPMLIPTSGTGKMIGIAQTKEDLDKMVTEDKENVHLTYKIKIQGPNAWRKFLELMAEHNMLEKD